MIEVLRRIACAFLHFRHWRLEWRDSHGDRHMYCDKCKQAWTEPHP